MIRKNELSMIRTVAILLFISITLCTLQVQAENMYVMNSSSYNCSVIDMHTNTVIATIPLVLDYYPYDIVSSQRNTKIYISNLLGRILVIDPYTNTVERWFASGGLAPISIAINEDSNILYVSHPSNEYSFISVIDLNSEQIINQVTLPDAYKCAYDKASNRLYVAQRRPTNTISILDGTTLNIIGQIPAYDPSSKVIVDSINNRLFAISHGGGTYVIDLNNNVIVNTIPTGLSYDGIYDTSVNQLYIAHYYGNTISVYDTNDFSTANSIPTGTGPQAILLDKSKNQLYVANRLENTFSIIDLYSNSPLTIIQTGTKPSAMALFSFNYAPPVANAGQDVSVDEGTEATLNGSASSDPDGDTLVYSWTQIGSDYPVSLVGADTANPNFIVPDVPRGGTTLTFQLIVNDGKSDSAPSTVNITVKNLNHAPLAICTPLEPTKEGSLVMLDGSKSYDPDAEPLSYSWEQTGGDYHIILSDSSDPKPTFTAPLIDSETVTLTFILSMNDGIESGLPCMLRVVVENVNHAPVGNAGPDQTINEGNQIAMDGSASTDPDGDPLSYSWNQVFGPQVNLDLTDPVRPRFNAPQVAPGGATIEFEITVSDGKLNGKDNVVITVQNLNDSPICEKAVAQPSILWPPNHKMLPAQIVGVTDPNNDQVSVRVVSVTQDEPVNGLGDGDTSPDASIQNGKVLLRSERAGGGTGRIYNVNFVAEDQLGGTCTGTVRVCVPIDPSHRSECLAGGEYYNSLQP